MWIARLLTLISQLIFAAYPECLWLTYAFTRIVVSLRGLVRILAYRVYRKNLTSDFGAGVGPSRADIERGLPPPHEVM